MNNFDPVVLARVQFAANMTFHILFPSISLGMGWMLLFFKVRFNTTAEQHWMDTYQFWVKIFALTFALGVVSGITMSFQFGTNWPGFMNTVGNVAGPLLAYEVLTAFFLEATMLGIMLFGRGRVSERVHTAATLLVALGTTLSAFWILALNSWMHTPAGFEMIDGKAHVTSWVEVIFNPSFPYRFTHMLIASGLTVSFLLAGLSAYRWLRGDQGKSVQASLRTGLYVAAVLIPLQIAVGDQHGLNTLHHQPAKIAAMEAIWDTQRGAPAVLFAMPDKATQTNRFEIAIPNLASLYLTHSWDGEIKGIKDFGGTTVHSTSWDHDVELAGKRVAIIGTGASAVQIIPEIAPVVWAFRIMVGVGLLMLAVSWLGSWQVRNNRLQPWMARVLVSMTFAGWVALVAGWYTTEIGRQPWLVQGVLTAAQAASHVPAGNIEFTLAMYLSTYAMLLSAYVSVVFHLARKAATGDAGGPVDASRISGAAHA